MNLTEWHDDVQPKLNDIYYHALRAEKCVSSLEIRPAWVSKAQDKMDELERKLEGALAAVRKAREEYARKPAEAA